jgi:hypothetical protein
VDGKEATLGDWPDDLHVYNARADSFVARVARGRAEASKLGQRLHNQNQTLILARKTGKPAEVPAPDIRLSLARKDQAALAKLREQSLTVDREVFAFGAKLQAFDYKGTAAEVALLAEMRSYLRSRPDDKSREALLANRQFRRAALQADVPPELSGLSSAAQKRLLDAELDATFPVERKTIADYERAEACVRSGDEGCCNRR